MISLSINDQDTFESSTCITRNSSKLQSSSTLWPPLKSARYCKKQKNRNGKGRGITPSMMLMHESSINHHRVTVALNELVSNGLGSAAIFDSSHLNSKPFWSKKVCQEFWNEYLECDSTLILNDLSHLSLKTDCNKSIEDLSCPHSCYTKITKSIRKLLKRTFTGSPSFSELETLVKSFNQGTGGFDLSCGQILSSSETLTVKLDTPFHRVWLHAICQYHGLFSQSKTVNDQRLVHIKTAATKNRIKPHMNLYNFLLKSK